MTEYNPVGPYIIKSGKRKGKSLEGLMFREPSFLSRQLRRIDEKSRENRKKNQMELHLEWLRERGENRQAQRPCPQCGKRPVRYFSVRYSVGGGFSASPAYTACEKCVQEIENYNTRIYPFRFSVIRSFSVKADQKIIADIFVWAFNLKSPLRKEALFKFFSE